jgi:hypothetical protein
LRQIGNPIAVHRVGPLRLALGLVHGGVGRRIDDQLRLHALNHRRHLRSIGNIQLCRTHPCCLEPRRHQAHQLMTDLAMGTGNQYTHIKVSISGKYQTLRRSRGLTTHRVPLAAGSAPWFIVAA